MSELDRWARDAVCGGLAESDDRALQAWLGEHPDHPRRWLEAVGFAEGLRSAAHLRDGVSQRRAPIRRPARWPLPVALAAGVLLAFAGWLLLAGRPGGGGTAAPAVARPALAAPAFRAESIALAAGMRREVRWPDGSSAVLLGPAAADVSPSAPQLDLHAGSVDCVIAKQERDPWRMAFPGGGLRVLGTAFTVSVASQSMEVAVSAGRVAVAPAGEAERVLAASETWRARGAGWEPRRDGDPAVIYPIAAPSAPANRMEYRRPAPGHGYANVSLAWLPGDADRAVIVPLRLISAAAGAAIDLMAVEADGDVWLLGSRPATEIVLGRWLTAGFTLVRPAKLQYRGGDGTWERASVRRLVFSVWQRDAVVDLGVPRGATARSQADLEMP